MSVLDNVKVGLHNSESTNLFDSIFRTPKYRKEEKNITEKALELLDVFGLKEEANFKASNLPYGKQRKLEIARALGTNPKLLLLDEPVSGIDQNGMELFYRTMDYLKKNFDLAIILISHDLDYVAKYADKVLLLNKTILKQGTPKEVYASEEFERIFGMEGRA